MKIKTLLLISFVACQGCAKTLNLIDNMTARMDGMPTASERAEITRNRRESYVNAHQGIDSEKKQDILAGRVSTGMTKEDVLAAWGGPRKADRLITSSGRAILVWRYFSVEYPTHLYFRDGVVHTISERGVQP